MQCQLLVPDLMPQLTNLINTHTASISPYCRLTDHHVATILSDITSLWNIYDTDPATAPIATTKPETLCIIHQGRLLVAAQWYAYTIPSWTKTAGSPSPVGYIPWIVAVPDHLDALRQLLQVIISRARHQKCQSCEGPSRYAFGIGWFGIPTVWSHLLEGFEAAGFVRQQAWLLMTGSTTSEAKPAPAPPRQLRLAYEGNDQAREWVIRAYADDTTMVGECGAWGVPVHLEGCYVAVKWIIIEWIEIEAAYQGQGIGRWLLAEQLRTQAQRGIENALLCTEPANVAMQRVAIHLGFHPAAESWVYSKELGDEHYD